jgi:cytochrome c peroxidase
VVARGKKAEMATKRTVILCFVCLLAPSEVSLAAGLTGQQQLGKDLFSDRSLSIKGNLACADCHGPAAGWTGSKQTINQHGAVYEGSIPRRFGNRKPPSAAYATFNPILYSSRKAGGIRLFIGGNFWDGRATGEKLGNPAADQAQEPFLNPLEQGLPDSSAVVSTVCAGSYTNLFLQTCGQESCNPANTNAAFRCIALAISAYEASQEVSAFTSKFDAYLAGKATLTRQEKEGYKLFSGNLFSDRAKCARCHVDTGKEPLFTDFTYDNLGVPRNPENPFYKEAVFNPLGSAWIDQGLGGYLQTRRDFEKYAKKNLGKIKVSTLRNVDKRPSPDFVKAYSHNGFFKSLKGIVHFYNTRDILPVCPEGFTETQALANNCWPPPEVSLNLNTKEMGDLGLTPEEEDAIVAFLKTLSDGYVP